MRAISIAVPTRLPPLRSAVAFATAFSRHNAAEPPNQRASVVATASRSALVKRGQPIQPTISAGTITASSRSSFALRGSRSRTNPTSAPDSAM